MVAKVYRYVVLSFSLSVCACSVMKSIDNGGAGTAGSRPQSKAAADIEAPPELAAEQAESSELSAESAHGTTSYSDYKIRKNAPRSVPKPAAATDVTDTAAANAAGLDKTKPTPAPIAEEENVTDSEAVFPVNGNSVELWGKIRTFFREAGHELESDDNQRPYVESGWIMEQKTHLRERYKVWVQGDKTSSKIRLVLSAEALRRRAGEMDWTPVSSDQEHVNAFAKKMQDALNSK